MKRMVRLIVLVLFPLVATELSFPQPPPNQKATTSQGTKGEALELGRSYAELRPEQVRLIDSFIRSYNATTGSALVPQQVYDGARLSIRTAFDAVSHALLNAQLTDSQGKSLGRAIDLVDAVDQVMGEESNPGRPPTSIFYLYLSI